jgi:pyruvate formate lyase activating enzyme
MQGIIFDIKHFAINDGPGIRQTIFFKGCPLKCQWCHNPESQSFNIEKCQKINKIGQKEFSIEVFLGFKIEPEKLLETILSDKVFFLQSKGGVTFSGGEPLSQPDFLYEIARKCKEHNIHTCLDTSGFATNDVFENISDCIDLFLFDLKIIDNKLHEHYTGVSNNLILENLIWLDKNKKNTIIRIPVINEITNTKKNIADITNTLLTLKNIKEIHLITFHPNAISNI